MISPQPRWGATIVLVAALVSGSPDRRSEIVDLAAAPAAKAPQLHMELSWTIPAGRVSGYDLRYSTTGPIDAAGWPSSNTVPAVLVPVPSAAATRQKFVVVGLKPDTRYWWAIRARDGRGSLGPISNCAPSATARYEGYGHRTVGGGERPLYRVTSLADAGPGSLRDAVSVGGRYVVFDVGGTIVLASRIDLRGPAKSFLTIDGSTAPAPGITIRFAKPLDDGVRIGDIDNLILTHLRLQGSFRFGTVPSERDDAISTNSVTGVASNMVWDHLTVRNVGDSAVDLWDRVQDFTMSYCLVMRNLHPMTTGGVAPSARQTIHHNLWADNGERHPQLLGRHTDFEYVNNVLYNWGYDPNPTIGYAKGSYAIRIRNNAPGPGDVDANIVNNYFLSSKRPDQALVYGSAKGPDPGEENGPAKCGRQGTVYTGSRMGQLWVSGNVFPRQNCDEYSTVSTARPTPVGARVTTDSAHALKLTLLPGVGTHFRQSDEQSLVNEVSTALSANAPVHRLDRLP